MNAIDELKSIDTLLIDWPGETTLDKVDTLLESQKSLALELSNWQRKEYQQEMHKVYKKAYKDTLDNRYILKDDLEKMSIKEIADMLGYMEKQ